MTRVAKSLFKGLKGIKGNDNAAVHDVLSKILSGEQYPVL